MRDLEEPLSPNGDRLSESKYSKHMLTQVYELQNSQNLSEDAIEVLFRVSQRKTSVKREIYAGFIQFMSCLYILTLIPYEMKVAGYDKTPAFCTTVSNSELHCLINNKLCVQAVCSAIGCILIGLTTNFPFIVTPPTAVTIYYTQKLIQQDMGHNGGAIGVMLSGLLLMICSWRVLGQFLTKVCFVCILL